MAWMLTAEDAPDKAHLRQDKALMDAMWAWELSVNVAARQLLDKRRLPSGRKFFAGDHS